MVGPGLAQRFLSNLIAINFPSDGYVTVAVFAFTQASGVVAPAPPVITLTLGPKESVVNVKLEPETTTVSPSDTTLVVARFMWITGIAEPVLANYNNTVDVVLGVKYAGQFSQLVNVNFSGFHPPSNYGITDASLSGFYGDDATALTYIGNWNTRWSGAPFPNQVTTYYNSSGGGVSATITAAAGYEVTLSDIVHDPGSITVTLIKTYLIRVPKVLTTMTLTISDDVVFASSVIAGYHGKAPAHVDDVDIAGWDTEEARTGHGTLTLTSEIAGNFNTVTITGGSGPGGGG